MSHSYNPVLVAVSIIIAAFASYSALDLAGRVTAARGSVRSIWLTAGALAMGAGIWSMHFIGMLAFEIAMPMAYDIPLVLLSVLVAILASGLAMFVVSREQLTAHRLMSAGVTMGIAIAGMHYIGMAAMRMPATITYNVFLVGVSLLVAIVASMAALWLAFTFRSDDTFFGYWRKGGAALVMGLAIAGMHYTGMSAARFVPRESMAVQPFSLAGTIPHGTPLAIAVITGSVLVFLLALASATLDRRARRAEQERLRMIATQQEMERQIDQRTAELRETLEAAEIASRSKSEFLARMSHELRTPLNSIIGFANVLHKNKLNSLRPQDIAYVERISVNGERLLLLINSILDLAKIESGKMEAEFTNVELGPLVTDVVGQLEGIIDGRKATLLIDIPEHIAPIRSDANKLRQILVNLIGNAAKFTEHGSITVRVVTDPNTGHPERMDVIDTGIGIALDRIPMLFKPFEQADNSITRRYGGTGLGLAITQSLSELLGLELTVKSTIGVGSTFSVHFTRIPHTSVVTKEPDPIANSMSTPPQDTEGTPAVRESRTVLIIDHDIDTRVLLRHYIEDAGYCAVEASSGTEGLQMAATVVPDLITLALMMPKVNGWEVLHRLKKDTALQHIPVVVISLVAKENRGHIFDAVDLIEKPFTREVVTDTLRRNMPPRSSHVSAVADSTASVR